jgi:hypothetical protein
VWGGHAGIRPGVGHTTKTAVPELPAVRETPGLRMSQARPKTRPKVAWELHVTYAADPHYAETSAVVTKQVGRLPASFVIGVTLHRLVYELPHKPAAQEAKRRVKAKLKSKVSCDIVPGGAT